MGVPHFGAVQNRLAFNTASTNNQIERITASESSISDADIVAEITNLTRAQILAQAATALRVAASGWLEGQEGLFRLFAASMQELHAHRRADSYALWIRRIDPFDAGDHSGLFI